MANKKLKSLRLIILGGVIILSLFFFGRAESYLIRTDPPGKADALVMLMGSNADRVLHTADLYQQGYAPAVILVELKTENGDRRPEQCAVRWLPRLNRGSRSPGMQNGDQNTENADQSTCHPDGFSRRGLPTHTRRASLIFRKTFRKEGLTTEVLVSPATRYQPVHEKPWWRRKEGIQSTLYEYVKLVSYLVIEQHQRR